MTILNTETGEIVEALSVDAARRLTDRIRLLAESLADTLDKLADMVDQARTGSAWLVLGYRSWTDYVSEEFSGILPRLDREPRREFARELSNRGMSTRTIAPVVGVSHKTVVQDMQVVPEVPPDAPVAAPPPITGRDGKTYERSKATERDLAEFIDNDTNIQDLRYMKAILAIADRAIAIGQYDAERVARIAEPGDVEVIDILADTVAEFHRKFTASRTGLRIIDGGSK